VKTNVLLIRTPEGIVFSQVLAGPVTRFLAWLIDALCIVGILTLLATLMRLLELVSPGTAAAIHFVGYFVVSTGYGMTLEWLWRGQTIGKKLFRLRVVDAEGMRLQFDQVATRNLLRVVDALPALYFVGGLTAWLNPHCKRLGDIAANTVVVRNPAISEPDLDQLLAGKFNSLRQHPHLAARLRQHVSPVEAATALQALLRRDEFEPVARIELFQELAQRFQSKVEFPAEATDGIADEQYIRNVVDVIYRPRQ
jgi:uncharacterized RDD family membrane protein YckC